MAPGRKRAPKKEEKEEEEIEVSPDLQKVIDALCSAQEGERDAVLAELRREGSADRFTELLWGVRWEGWSFKPHARFRDRLHSYGYDRLVFWLLYFAPPGCEAADALAANIGGVTLASPTGSPMDLGNGSALRRFQAATSLTLHQFSLDKLDVFSELPALRELRLSQGKVPDGLPGMSLGPGVEGLQIWCPLTNLDGLSAPGLQRLDLTDHALDSLERLPQLPALAQLSINGSRLRSLRGLERFTGLQWLNLCDCEALESFEGLPANPGLTSFARSLKLPQLRDLSALPELPGVAEFDLLGLEHLERLDGIERLKNLTQVGLKGVKLSVDLAPLAHLTKLQVLDLRGSTGITSVSALDELSSLRVVLVHGSGVTRKAVHADLRWRCSWSERPKIWRLLKDNQPKEAKPRERSPTIRSEMSPDSKSTLASLRKLLASQELSAIQQALEMLKVLEDPQLYDALLEGADYSQVARRGWRVGSSKFSGPTLDYLVHSLIADAPPESALASALRERITELDFVEIAYRSGGRPLDLGSLAVLPLKRLNFSRFGPLTAPEDLALPELVQFHLSGTRGDFALGWLARSPKLTSVKLEANGSSADDLCWVTGLEHLDTLEIANGSPELASLAGSSVRRVRLASCSPHSLGALLEAPKLKTFYHWNCSGLTEADQQALEARGVNVQRSWKGWL